MTRAPGLPVRGNQDLAWTEGAVEMMRAPGLPGSRYSRLGLD